MKQDMYADAVRAMKKAYEPTLAWFTLRHANKTQATELGKKFPQYYKVAKTGRVTFSPQAAETGEEWRPGTKATAKQKVTRTKAGVKKTVTLGGYGHEAAAKRECQQLLHPNVFIYQSAIFPNPRDHGVSVKVEKAEPVKLESPTTPLYPWGVRMALTVDGPVAKAEAWCQKFDARIRTQAGK